MSAYLPIWDILAYTSAQNAMSKSELITKLDMDDAELDSKLDEMYEHRMIGRAKIIKGDVNDMFYWRVGVLKNIGEYGRTSYQQPQIAPPRRDEIAKQNIPQKNALTEKESTMNTVTDLNAEAEKPNALRVLEYIEAHPDCSPKEITNNADIDYPVAFIKGPIKRGLVLQQGVGERGKMTLRLAPGMTAKLIYGKGRKSNGKNLGKPKSQMIAKKEESYDIPAFLRRDQAAQTDVLKTEITPPKIIPIKSGIQLNLNLEEHVKRLLSHVPEGCHITLRHPEHENIRVEIDGTLLANPIQADLEKLGTVFDAIKTLQHAALL